jgi:hypothetical protein
MRNLIRTALIVGTLATPMISMADAPKKDAPAATDAKKDTTAAPATKDAPAKTDAKATEKKAPAAKKDAKKADAKEPAAK